MQPPRFKTRNNTTMPQRKNKTRLQRVKIITSIYCTTEAMQLSMPFKSILQTVLFQYH